MFRCIVLGIVCLLIMTACHNNVGDYQPGTDEIPLSTESEFSGLELTKLELDVPFNQNHIMCEDSGFVLGNGYIVIQKFTSMRRGNTYFRQYIYDIDGNRIHPGKEKYYQNYYRVVLETDQGNIFLTDSHGKTMMFDSDWNEVDTRSEMSFYHAYPLDKGMYFAVNDVYMLDYEYGLGEGTTEPEVFYALYRYTEKLTDTVFKRIIPCDGGFECFYADSIMPGESIIIKVDDMAVEDEKNDFSVLYDSSTGKYYCINDVGEKIFDKSFDYIAEPNNNASIAYSDNSIYIIRSSTKMKK